MTIKNKLFAGLTALVFSLSCAHAPVNPKDKLRDTCLNLLWDARKMILQRDNKITTELWQDKWCNDYGKIREDIAELSSYLVK